MCCVRRRTSRAIVEANGESLSPAPCRSVSARASGSTCLVLVKRPWATATRELKSASVSGTFEIDVVTEAAFADYVRDRLGFAQAVADKVGEDPLRYTGESESPSG